MNYEDDLDDLILMTQDSVVNQSVGVKYDCGKLRWGLLPWISLKPVVRVLMFGAEKYAPDNWKSVERPEERYSDAALRHITSWLEGDKTDPETGENHLAHAVCCLLFLLWFEDKR